MGASVRARLLTLAREKGQAFDLLLTRLTKNPDLREHAGVLKVL